MCSCWFCEIQFRKWRPEQNIYKDHYTGLPYVVIWHWAAVHLYNSFPFKLDLNQFWGLHNNIIVWNLACFLETTAKYAAIQLPSKPRAMARFSRLIQDSPWVAWFLLLEIATLRTSAHHDGSVMFCVRKIIGHPYKH